MGDEIEDSHFTPADFVAFRARLDAETRLLESWFAAQRFDIAEPVGGCEIEAWLVDKDCAPAPRNPEFLDLLEDPYVVPELALYNIELNTAPRPLSGDGISHMQRDITSTWSHCRQVARQLDLEPLMIGTLPTLCDAHLNVAHMSSMQRYKALNEQVLRMRRGHPLVLDIEGRDHLSAVHGDVMLEAAATSFQIHLQVTQARAVAAFNAAIMLSAPMVALAANSPYLFGCDLWAESRIPVFEQAVAMSTARHRQRERVTFGDGYLHGSLNECFIDNLQHFPPLLPEVMDEPEDALCHLRLHNGTIWRWNRPLIGFSDDGAPHLRIEHRVVPAGPSMIDAFANAAVFYGMVHALAASLDDAESRLPFAQARANFYAAARAGLDAQLVWYDGKRVPVRDLISNHLLPLAREGLMQLAVDDADVARYVEIISARVKSGQNGAVWQRRYVARHGPDMQALTGAYLERHNTGVPVHEWSV